MPLPAPVERQELHHRAIDMRGYSRSDGLYEIEGRITDIKSKPVQPPGGRAVPAGTPLHEMWVRLVIDDRLVVQEVHAATDFSPFPECGGAVPNLQTLQGASMGRGWRKVIAEQLGGVQGCTHIRELLNTMGSAAHQTMNALRRSKGMVRLEPGKMPPALNTCHAFDEHGVVVTRRWPELFPKRNAGKG